MGDENQMTQANDGGPAGEAVSPLLGHFAPTVLGPAQVPSGTLAGSPVQLQGAADQVQITIEEVMAIARQHLPGAEDDVTVATRDFRNLDLDPGAFGEVPAARHLGVQHQAVHEVFVETVNGVTADLRDFADQLLASAQAHQDSDDAVHATLLTFASGYSGHVSQADDSFDRARSEQGDKLGVEPAGGEQAGVEPMIGPVAPTPPADAPAAPPSGTGFEG